jgi:ABC-type phosphate transport system ATPase subunit
MIKYQRERLRVRTWVWYFKTESISKTIFENVAYGLRVNNVTDKKEIERARDYFY